MTHTTINACARFHFPDASPEEIEALIWACTAYPACGFEYACQQIAEARNRANTVADAWYLADGETARIMGEIARRK